MLDITLDDLNKIFKKPSQILGYADNTRHMNNKTTIDSDIFLEIERETTSDGSNGQ